MNSVGEQIVVIFSGLLTLAIIAVVLSNKANTANVLGAAGSAFANAVSAADGPITGNAATPNLTVGTGGNTLALPALSNLLH